MGLYLLYWRSQIGDLENNFMHTKKQSCWSTILLAAVNCFYKFCSVDCASDDALLLKIQDVVNQVSLK